MAYLTVEMSDSLTAEHLDCLNKANIWTVNDLCSCDIMDIKRQTNIKYYILRNLQLDLRKRYTLPCVDCNHLVERSIRDCKMCPTGIPELTAALDGGFMTQEIVELSGDSGTGKTELCYLLCGEILSHYDDYQILFVTSQSDFDVDKIAKYTRSKSIGRTLSDEDIFNCLARVSVARPTRLADLVHLLNTIVHGDKHNTVKCIIIDSLSFIIQDDILEIKTNDGLAAKESTDIYLTEVMRILITIAINKNAIVLITNSNHSNLPYYKSWTNGIDHRIHLSDNPRRATILKTIHNISKINYSIPFEINDDGLFAIRYQDPKRRKKSESPATED